MPKDGGESTLETLKQQLAGLHGKVALVETTAGGYGQGQAYAPREDWNPRRLGGAWASALKAMIEAGLSADEAMGKCGLLMGE